MQSQEETSQYRLHHFPFFLIWVASFGVAWMLFVLSESFWNSNLYEIEIFRTINAWVYRESQVLAGLAMALIVGGFLAFVQPWLIRWRYGFVPRFWRLATLIGILVLSPFFASLVYPYTISSLSTSNNEVYFRPNYYLALYLWLLIPSLVQSLVLWPLVHRAWLYPLAGIGAAGVASFIGYAYRHEPRDFTMMLVIGTFALAVFSALIFLYLMRSYKLEAVPKRDEKSKGFMQSGLNPMGFIFLWGMGHFSAWVGSFGLNLVAMTIGYFFPFIFQYTRGFLNPYTFSLLLGLSLGIVTAFSQAWLMRHYRGYQPRFWLRLSIPAYFIASIALNQIMRDGHSYPHNPLRELLFLVWFAVPPLIQSLAFARDLRGSWIYALAGLLTVALVYLQLNWSASGYAFFIGLIAQSILTSIAFLIIMRLQPKESSKAS